MKYLESAIKFLIKNWLLAVPLFVLVALGTLLSGASNAAVNLSQIWGAYGNIGQWSNPSTMLSNLPSILPAFAVGGGFLVLIFNFVAIPVTYGLINKSLETGNAGLNDIGTAVSQNFVKYVMYFIGTLVVSLAIGIGSFIILLIFGLLSSLIKPLIILTVLVGIAIGLAVIVFMVLLSMWLSAMVVDGFDVVAAAKKSIEVVKSCFWTIIGITILVSIACGIASFILGFLRFIPLLGGIIISVVPTAQTFIMAVFLLTVYREKTGKINSL